MEKQDRIVGFPPIGIYTKDFMNLFKTLGLKVLDTIPMTDETAKLGTKYSPEFICWPYKVILGNFIQLMRKKANTLIMYSSCGTCKQRHYYKLAEQELKRRGFKFEMIKIGPKDVIPLPLPSFLDKLVYLSGYNKLKLSKIILNAWIKVAKLEKAQKKSWGEINIGITGEIYTVISEDVNYDIKSQLEKLGATVHTTLSIREVITNKLWRTKERKQLRKICWEYLDEGGDPGGHGLHSIEDSLLWSKQKFDGIIHIEPLSCLKGDTNIVVEGYGIKQIKNVIVGEKVLTHKGRFKKVTKKFVRNYNGNLLELNCGGMSKLEITPKHPVLTIKREDVGYASRKKDYNNLKPKFVMAKELKLNDFIAIPIPTNMKKISYFDYKEKGIKLNKHEHKYKYKPIKRLNYNSETMRFLGYYLAEGCILKHDKMKYKGGIIFTFNKKEVGYINDVKKIVNQNFDANIALYSHLKRPNVTSIYITNGSLAHIIYYLCREYCWKKVLHNELMSLPPPLQLEIVKGFFRGDAGIEDNKVCCRYKGTTTSKQLASQLFWILIRNGIKPSISSMKRINKKKYYVVSINNYYEIKRMEPKLNLIKKESNPRFIKTKKYFFLPIRKIKKQIFNGKVYNLEVEEDNSYVANFLTVHNCHPEILVEDAIDDICKSNNIPLLRIKIDETSSLLNTATRIETFIWIIKWRKGKYKKKKLAKNIGIALGIDIGSSSTKAVLINEKQRIIESSYIKSRDIDSSVKEVLDNINVKKYKIAGAGVTGSGRVYAKQLISADVVIPETVAHTLGTLHTFPSVKTVIDIGCEDSKLMLLEHKVPYDFSLNTVCSSGMGNTLDNVSTRLGIDITEFGDLALKSKKNISFPMKCGVMMGTEVVQKKNAGEKVEDILRASCDAVVRNFLNLTSKGKDLKEQIVFQGMTAYNKGLIKAFEENLGKKIIIPHQPELRGAFGTALFTQEEMAGKESTFNEGVRTIKKAKIKHNDKGCIACGACYRSLPKYFKSLKDKKSKNIKTEIDEKDLEKVKEIIRFCPVNLIEVVEDA